MNNFYDHFSTISKDMTKMKLMSKMLRCGTLIVKWIKSFHKTWFKLRNSVTWFGYMTSICYLLPFTLRREMLIRISGSLSTLHSQALISTKLSNTGWRFWRVSYAATLLDTISLSMPETFSPLAGRFCSWTQSRRKVGSLESSIMEGQSCWKSTILESTKTISKTWLGHRTILILSIFCLSKFNTRSTSSPVLIDFILSQELKPNLRDISISWRLMLHLDRILASFSMFCLLRVTLFSLKTKIQCKMNMRFRLTREIQISKSLKEAIKRVGPINWTSTPWSKFRK